MLCCIKYHGLCAEVFENNGHTKHDSQSDKEETDAGIWNLYDNKQVHYNALVTLQKLVISVTKQKYLSGTLVIDI